MSKKKVVLAYSGGLDTSVILKWLLEKNFEVICFVGDVGQQESFSAIAGKGLTTGASRVYIEDLRHEFVTDYIFPALQANASYENGYLLGTALARPLLASRQVAVAIKEDADFLAHGATGKGNDQVRFELAYAALAPHLEIVAPWKDNEFLDCFFGRKELLAYAEAHQIPIKANRKNPFSEDENLFHCSHEAGILEDPGCTPPANAFSISRSPQQAPDRETIIELTFTHGLPTLLHEPELGISHAAPLELFLRLNTIGAVNGVGRIDIVENRFIGIKSRGIYETPGGTILWAAHRDLECLTLDKAVMRLRDSLSPTFSEMLYNGFWFSPEAQLLREFFSSSQHPVSGLVRLSIYKGNVQVIGRESPCSLYQQAVSSMDEKGGFDSIAAKGFIDMHALRLRQAALQKQKRQPVQIPQVELSHPIVSNQAAADWHCRQLPGAER